MLGRLALLHDDVESAEKCLLLSGQITDGPATFWGPNMTLARELLKRHRTEGVLQFLDEAAHFWREPHGQLDRWVTVIRAGKGPFLGANMLY